MKKLELNQYENIVGGNQISDTITGVCAGIGVSTALKLITLSTAAAIGVAAVCSVNSAGNYFDWW
jgi:Na+-transporting NADH:ubiquinone oxidoreductase subunit NqrD